MAIIPNRHHSLKKLDNTKGFVLYVSKKTQQMSNNIVKKMLKRKNIFKLIQKIENVNKKS